MRRGGPHAQGKKVGEKKKKSGGQTRAERRRKSEASKGTRIGRTSKENERTASWRAGGGEEGEALGAEERSGK